MEQTGHQSIDVVCSYKRTSVGYCNGVQESNTEITLLLTETNSGKVYQYPTAISFNSYQVTYFITFREKFPHQKILNPPSPPKIKPLLYCESSNLSAKKRVIN